MARSTARTAAMQMIYENLAGGDGGDDSLLMIYNELRAETQTDAVPVGSDEPGLSDRSYIDRAVKGVNEHRGDLERVIGGASKGWTLERMPWVDRTILMLATWEIMYPEESDVPGGVAINEAVSLANRFSDPDQSSRFINGVLGTILRNRSEQS